MPAPRGYRHPIYGASVRKINKFTCAVTDMCKPTVDMLYSTFNTLLQTVEKVVTECFPPANAVSSIIADMNARAFVSPLLFVRLAWREQHPTETFNMQNLAHKLQIKWLYELYGFHDWIARDPLKL